MEPSSPTPEQERQAEKFERRRVAQAVYQLYPDPEERNDPHHVDIVVFHGLQMPGSEPAYSFWRTWKTRTKDSEDCWLETMLPSALREQDRELRARVLAVKYEGRPRQKANYNDSDKVLVVERLIQELITLEDVNLGQKAGVPVFLLGHDLGGVLIMDFVLQAEDAAAVTVAGDPESERKGVKLNKFLENLKYVWFFAAPHAGSEVLQRMAEDIEVMEEQHQMLSFLKVLDAKKSRINSEFEKYRTGNSRFKRPSFYTQAVYATHTTEVQPYGTVKVVQEASMRQFADNLIPVDANHFQVCQADSKFFTPLRMLKDQIFRSVPGDPEALESQPPGAKNAKLRDLNKGYLDRLDDERKRAATQRKSENQSEELVHSKLGCSNPIPKSAVHR